MSAGRFVGIAACLVASTAFAQEIFSKTDTQAEIEWGRTYYEGLLRSGMLSANETYRRRVQRILDQLQETLPNRPYPFQAVVIVDVNNKVNAGCYPGGYMVVHEGLLVAMPEDAQLAFTLGHEMGHAIRRHWARDLRQRQTDTLIDVLAGVLTKFRYDAPDRTLQYLAYSRQHETEADEFGTEIYLRAGFPPDKVGEGLSAFVRLEAESGSRTPEYARSHPASEKRLKNIQALSKKLIEGGLKPISAGDPVDVSVKNVFGALPSISAQGTDILPFVPGTEWTYTVQGPSGSTSYKTRVVGCAEVLSSKVARFETKVGERTVPYQVMADAYRIYRRNRPDKPESKWTVEAIKPDFGGTEVEDNVQYRHAGIETVETPAGTFADCVKIEIKNAQGRVVNVWYAPGVGMVKRVNETANVIETLSAYHKG